jgi:hypothetical protein
VVGDYGRAVDAARAALKPDAVDVSDTELARRIVEEEQARLGDGREAPVVRVRVSSGPQPVHRTPVNGGVAASWRDG